MLKGTIQFTEAPNLVDIGLPNSAFILRNGSEIGSYAQVN